MPSKLPLIIGIFIAFLLAGAFVLMDRPQDSGLLPGNEAPYMPSTENNEEMPPAPPANDQQANEEGEASDGPSQQNEEQARSIVISYGPGGYSPASAPVRAGTKVIFRNDRVALMWPASAMHPTHMVYPGSSIEKCATPEQPSIFDACTGIAMGGMWSFTFSEKGTWRYHDHLQPSHFGTIIVE